MGCWWVHSHVSLQCAVILTQCNEGVEFRQAVLSKEMPSSVVQRSWLLGSSRQRECRYSLRVCVCFFENLKHPVAAALHSCLTAATTGEPQLSLQSQLKCYEVECALFIYLFLLAGNSHTVTVTPQNWLRVSSLFLLLQLNVGKL